MTITTNDLSAALSALPDGADVAVVRDGERFLMATEPVEVIRANGAEAFDVLDTITGGWWAGFLSYDLGRAVERFDERHTPGSVPDLLLARFERDHIVAVEPRAGRVPDGDRRLTWTSSIDRDGWIERVARIKEHLLDGDCYQVNLTRRLVTDIELDPVALFRAVQAGNPAPHAALVRCDGIAVVSASPERFLRRDGRRVETRPIKGTARDAAVLAASAKDRAENVMIVDLARNDLGRVCRTGSIHVPELFGIEAHPGLHHLVSTVRGELRDDVGGGALVRATFPPASVTGCPKPRVLDIIESLETVRREVYCGAVGFIDADGDVLDLNVAIRTFTIGGGITSFGVGGGIVADSDAAAEWDETELKAANLLRIASAL